MTKGLYSQKVILIVPVLVVFYGSPLFYRKRMRYLTAFI
jgi:hypothetical protein